MLLQPRAYPQRWRQSIVPVDVTCDPLPQTVIVHFQRFDRCLSSHMYPLPPRTHTHTNICTHANTHTRTHHGEGHTVTLTRRDLTHASTHHETPAGPTQPLEVSVFSSGLKKPCLCRQSCSSSLCCRSRSAQIHGRVRAPISTKPLIWPLAPFTSSSARFDLRCGSTPTQTWFVSAPMARVRSRSL